MCRPSSSLAVVSALALSLAAAGVGAQVPPANPSKAAAKAVAQPAAQPPAQVQAPAAQPAIQPVPGGAPPAAVAATEAPGGAPAQPGGLLVPGSEFRYDPTGRRDPFKSLLALEEKAKDLSKLPPIQQFDLSAVKVVGIVVDPGGKAQAMIRSPEGKTFVVHVGTVVGKNDGLVTAISMDGITVVEKFLDFMNRETRKETFLKSHAGAGARK